MKKIILLVSGCIYFFFSITSTLCQTNTFIINESNNVINNQSDLPLDSAVLKWDNGWVNHLGFGQNTSAIVAARFPDTLTTIYSGYYLVKIQIAISDLPSIAILRVFAEGTDTTAGISIYSKDITNLITPYSLNDFEINPPILITGNDIWIGYEVALSETDITIGIDNGPLNPDGDWLYSPAIGVWYHLSLFGYINNWVIRGYLSNIVSVENIKLNPTSFSLEQNYPNPFNPSTIIKYTISSVITSETKQSQLVTLKVYDILGNEVATLVNEEKPAGSYEVEFNAAGLSSGMYFYKLQAGNPSTGSGRGFVETKKMILMK